MNRIVPSKIGLEENYKLTKVNRMAVIALPVGIILILVSLIVFGLMTAGVVNPSSQEQNSLSEIDMVAIALGVLGTTITIVSIIFSPKARKEPPGQIIH